LGEKKKATILKERCTKRGLMGKMDKTLKLFVQSPRKNEKGEGKKFRNRGEKDPRWGKKKQIGIKKKGTKKFLFNGGRVGGGPDIPRQKGKKKK